MKARTGEAVLGAVVVSLCVSLSWANTYYVRNGGAGLQDGSSWGNAYASLQTLLNALPSNAVDNVHIVNVEASGTGQAYDVATRSFTIGHLYVNFEGGWEDVDGSPTQTGYSTVKDLDATIDERGLNIESPGTSHDRRKVVGVRRFIFTDVSDGIRLYNPSNLQNSFLQLSLSSVSIVASSNGVWVEKPGYNDFVQITGDGLTVQAGQNGGTGHGIYEAGYLSASYPSVISNSTINSSGGDGIMAGLYGNTGNWSSGHRLTVQDCVVSGSSGDGIWMGDVVGVEPIYNQNSYLVLNRVRVTGNAGHGVYCRLDENDSYGAVTMCAYMTNCVIAGNAGHGVFLDCNADARAAKTLAAFVNCTVADNGTNAIRGLSSESVGNSCTAYNTILSGQGDAGIFMSDQSAGGPTITETYNDFHGNGASDLVQVGTGGTNYPALNAADLQVAPMFVAQGDHPYRLAFNSPLPDAGSATYAPDVDVVGDGRPVGAADSIGAYETAAAMPNGTVFRFQ